MAFTVDVRVVAVTLVAEEIEAKPAPQGATLSPINCGTNQATRVSTAGINSIRISNLLLHHHFPMHTSLQHILFQWYVNLQFIIHPFPLLLLGFLVQHHLCSLTLPQ